MEKPVSCKDVKYCMRVVEELKTLSRHCAFLFNGIIAKADDYSVYSSLLCTLSAVEEKLDEHCGLLQTAMLVSMDRKDG